MTPPVHELTSLPSGAVVHSWTPHGPARAAVVVQHGFGEYAERFLDQHSQLVPHLGDLGYAVWALDLWGHGRSPGPRGVVHIGRAVADHRATRALASSGGLPVLLLGHSLGGLVTACSAAAGPEGVGGVVLLSPSLPDREPTPVRRALGAWARLRPAAPIPSPRRPLAELAHDPSVGARAARDPRMFGGQVGVLTAATALDAVAELRAAAARWAHPTLVVHGTEDTYAAPEASAEFVTSLAGDASLELVDGARHELLNDTCATIVRRLVIDQLDAWVRPTE